MPAENLAFKNRSVRMKSVLPESVVSLKNARVEEGLSRLTETRIEFLSSDMQLDLQKVLGTRITLEVDGEDEAQGFSGLCISAEYVGLYQGMLHIVAEVRPWLWMLTRTRNSRIYQEKTAHEIIKSVLSDHGFSADLSDKVQGSYLTRTYCVQYRETDFDFISRLMEEEGIYYYFQQVGDKEKLVLCDDVSAHMPVPGNAEIEFHFAEPEYRRRKDHIFEWTEATHLTSGKVTLDDYFFETPRSELKTTRAIPKGQHSYKDFELYDHPGRYTTSAHGNARSRVRMQAEAVRHLKSHGIGNVRGLRVGRTFRLKGHDRVGKVAPNDFLILNAVHLLQIESDYEDRETTTSPFRGGAKTNAGAFGPDNRDTYRCVFEVMPKKEPFRALQTTPWPEIPGLQTAMVTGPSGEEIHTDEFGRIKVQFHWDRQGKKDEKTSCWVRCVMPWTGKNWGMIHIPRIGQEVAIQFEEGDPDRPICTGMLYNGDTKPPYPLPANMTQSGIVTRSSKGGSASTFNELIFEDKKDAEFVRMQSEKDYKQTIKNNAEITIGLEKKDKGDLTQTIHRHKTETLNTGDHVFTVKAGNQKVSIKKDHTETIEGKATQTITGNTTQTIKQGNYRQTIKMGDVTRSVDMGNEKHTVKLGNYDLKTSVGATTIEALQKIELKCGMSKITMTPTQITIESLMVDVKATTNLNVKGLLTTVSADAIMTVKGALTMIN